MKKKILGLYLSLTDEFIPDYDGYSKGNIVRVESEYKYYIKIYDTPTVVTLLHDSWREVKIFDNTLLVDHENSDDHDAQFISTNDSGIEFSPNVYIENDNGRYKINVVSYGEYFYKLSSNYEIILEKISTKEVINTESPLLYSLNDTEDLSDYRFLLKDLGDGIRGVSYFYSKTLDLYSNISTLLIDEYRDHVKTIDIGAAVGYSKSHLIFESNKLGSKLLLGSRTSHELRIYDELDEIDLSLSELIDYSQLLIDSSFTNNLLLNRCHQFDDTNIVCNYTASSNSFVITLTNNGTGYNDRVRLVEVGEQVTFSFITNDGKLYIGTKRSGDDYGMNFSVLEYELDVNEQWVYIRNILNSSNLIADDVDYSANISFSDFNPNDKTVVLRGGLGISEGRLSFYGYDSGNDTWVNYPFTGTNNVSYSFSNSSEAGVFSDDNLVYNHNFGYTSLSAYYSIDHTLREITNLTSQSLDVIYGQIPYSSFQTMYYDHTTIVLSDNVAGMLVLKRETDSYYYDLSNTGKSVGFIYWDESYSNFVQSYLNNTQIVYSSGRDRIYVVYDRVINILV